MLTIVQLPEAGYFSLTAEVVLTVKSRMCILITCDRPVIPIMTVIRWIIDSTCTNCANEKERYQQDISHESWTRDEYNYLLEVLSVALNC